MVSSLFYDMFEIWQIKVFALLILTPFSLISRRFPSNYVSEPRQVSASELMHQLTIPGSGRKASTSSSWKSNEFKESGYNTASASPSPNQLSKSQGSSTTNFTVSSSSTSITPELIPNTSENAFQRRKSSSAHSAISHESASSHSDSSSSSNSSAGPLKLQLQPTMPYNELKFAKRSSSLFLNKSGSLPSATKLPPNWYQKFTPDGQVYYFNAVTDETTWNLQEVEILGNGRRPTTPVMSPTHMPQPSFSSSASASSASSSQQPLNVTTTITPPTPTNGSPILQNQSDQPVIKWTWKSLVDNIITNINYVQQATQMAHKDRYIPIASHIVESIRTMLYASGTAKKDSTVIAKHKHLKLHHRNIMSSLSKLVLAAKLAAGLWPPPDSASKLSQAAGEVLVSVRHFSAIAEEAGVELKSSDEIPKHEPLSTVTSPKSSTAPTSPHYSSSTANFAPHVAYALEKAVSRHARRPSHSSDSSDSSTTSPAELIAQMERYASMVSHTIGEVSEELNILSIKDMNKLISDVRCIVTDVGCFLMLVDELSLEQDTEQAHYNDFKMARLGLFNAISGLVMATQTASNPLAPSNAVEDVIVSAATVEKSMMDLFLATKFLLEEKNASEQQRLQSISTAPTTSAPRPRRALSMSLVANALDETVAVGIQQRERSSSQTEGSSSSTMTTDGLDESGIDSKIYRVGSKDKVKKLLGDEAPIPEVDQRQENWYLQHDYQPNEIMFDPSGRVKGGTIAALIARLTMHDEYDSYYTLVFLLTFRTFMPSLDFVHELILRYNISLPSSLSTHEQAAWIDRKQKPIRLRVLNLLRIWSESYFVEALPGDSKALAEINAFVSEIAATEFPAAAQQLLRSVESRRKGDPARRPSISYAYSLSSNSNATSPHTLSSSSSSTSVFTQQPALVTPPPPILPKSMRRIRFLDIDPLELARQLTILEADVFRSSASYELLKKAWSDKENPSAAPTIRRMIEISNQITFWVASAVLREKDVKKRGSIMKHFILIADVSSLFSISLFFPTNISNLYFQLLEMPRSQQFQQSHGHHRRSQLRTHSPSQTHLGIIILQISRLHRKPQTHHGPFEKLCLVS